MTAALWRPAPAVALAAPAVEGTASATVTGKAEATILFTDNARGVVASAAGAGAAGASGSGDAGSTGGAGGTSGVSGMGQGGGAGGTAGGGGSGPCAGDDACAEPGSLCVTKRAPSRPARARVEPGRRALGGNRRSGATGRVDSGEARPPDRP